MAEVICSVTNCEYWGKGNVCRADKIWINNNSGEDLTGDIEFADELDFLSEGELVETSESESAVSSYQTCCETMRPRNRGEEENMGPLC